MTEPFSAYSPEHKVHVDVERVFRAGYIVRTENIDGTILQSAYTPDGAYIGSAKDAHFLCAVKGIRPQLRTPTSNVCSIGFSVKDAKWYGWSHRAIHGFRRGDVVKEGDCTAAGLPVGFRALSIRDAKRMAEAFAESVS